MLSCIIGSAVSGKEHFGRDSELKAIWESVKNGSVLLVSPRRFGKTSLVFNVRDFPKSGYRVFYLDVEYLDRPENFIVEIMDKTTSLKDTKTKLVEGFSSILKMIEVVGVMDVKLKLREYIKPDWENKGNHVFKQLTAENDLRPIFIVDELPSMILNMIRNDDNGIKTAKLFLNWLRQLRISYDIRFIICGSIGIDQVITECDAVDTINDLKRIMVNPLSESQSKEMIKQLFDGLSTCVDAEIIQKIYEQVGVGVPFFIKILIQAVVDEMNENESKLSVDIIEKAYNEKVLGVGGRGYFEHYFTRLDHYYKNGLGKIAKSILDHLAIRQVVSLEDLKQLFFQITKSNDTAKFTALINRLEGDFYLTMDISSKNCRFYTKVLEDLWRNRRGL